MNIVSTKMKNTVATSVSVNSDGKKVACKINCNIFQTVLLQIILLLIIAVLIAITIEKIG